MRFSAGWLVGSATLFFFSFRLRERVFDVRM
jgi:hypothetical protein